MSEEALVLVLLAILAALLWLFLTKDGERVRHQISVKINGGGRASGNQVRNELRRFRQDVKQAVKEIAKS